MPTDIELGWLAGIIDGEGSIFAEWSNRHREVGGSISIMVQVEACSEAMILKVAGLLKELGVHFYLGKYKPRAGNRPSHQILIKKRSEVLKVLRLMRAHLVVKQKEADLAVWFYERWGDQRCRNTALAPKDEKIYVFEEMRRLKKMA